MAQAMPKFGLNGLNAAAVTGMTPTPDKASPLAQPQNLLRVYSSLLGKEFSKNQFRAQKLSQNFQMKFSKFAKIAWKSQNFMQISKIAWNLQKILENPKICIFKRIFKKFCKFWDFKELFADFEIFKKFWQVLRFSRTFYRFWDFEEIFANYEIFKKFMEILIFSRTFCRFWDFQEIFANFEIFMKFCKFWDFQAILAFLRFFHLMILKKFCKLICNKFSNFRFFFVLEIPPFLQQPKILTISKNTPKLLKFPV